MEPKVGKKAIVITGQEEAILCLITTKYTTDLWRLVPLSSTGKLRPKQAMFLPSEAFEVV